MNKSIILTEAVKPEPPKGRSNIECNHKWIYQGSDYTKTMKDCLGILYNYQKVDTYYCEKCLEIRENVAKDEDKYYDKPSWFKE